MSAPAATSSFQARWPEPFEVTWVGQTGSTNADLVQAARQGARHGSVLVADHQTAGRGRLGRTWTAPPGGALLCSVLVWARPGAVLHGAVWAVALAARAAVLDVAGVVAELKWPNDLMVGDRKLAGILAEGVDRVGAAPAVVVGIGVNLGWREPPPDVAARAVTLEELAGHAVARRELLGAMLGELAPLLELWASDPGSLRDRYRAELATLGRAVRVTTADRELEGVAVGLTEEGALVVQVGDAAEVIAAGDVVHLRPGRGRCGDDEPGRPAGRL